MYTGYSNGFERGSRLIVGLSSDKHGGEGRQVFRRLLSEMADQGKH